MSTFRANWSKLLTPERVRTDSDYKKEETDNRSEFDNDYDRIIFSSAFRRLQDKAQVFPLEDGDFVRTRLTHSFEVAAIAESIGISIEKYLLEGNKDGFTDKKKGQLGKVLRCAGLLHDIGNTPFGHFGEFAIQDFFDEMFENDFEKIRDKYLKESIEKEDEKEAMKQLKEELELLKEDQDKKYDFVKFDGNAQALRLVGYLQGVNKKGGMNLTYATLSSIIKYPRSSSEGNKKNNSKISYKKYGYLQSEKNLFENIVQKTGLLNDEGIIIRNPIVYILEAADDIAYSASDIEDGIKKGLITLDVLKDKISEVMDLDNEEYKNIKGAFDDKIEFGAENVFTRAQMLRIAIQGFMISSVIKEFKKSYNEIMKGTYEKELLNESEAGKLREKLKEVAMDKIFKNKEILKVELAGKKVIFTLLDIFINALLLVKKKNEVIGKDNERIYGIISDNYKAIYEEETDGELYDRIQLIVDFVSGMTDHYALSLYKQLQGVIL